MNIARSCRLSRLEPAVQPEPQSCWRWEPAQIYQWQLARLNQQLAAILSSNAFYRRKFGSSQLQLQSLEELAGLPLTDKQELVEAQAAQGLSDHHTFPADQYRRVHRTSGTSGTPLLVMDTADDWQWWADTWQHVLAAAEVTQQDRVFMAFSFGPFIGFWSAYEACVQRGARLIPGGGLSSIARLEFMRQTAPTVIACTPSYALQLAEVAVDCHFPLDQLPIRRLIVAGEPGGSLPQVRQRIEESWGAQVVDHCGATEIGPWGFGWPTGGGVHVIETSFIAELLPVAGQQPDEPLRELVLTSLGRWGAPVFRYRTGDLVRAERPADGPCRFLWLREGIIGRADDMVVVRGVNVFPSSIEAVVRRFPQIGEYRVTIRRRGQLDDLTLEVECSDETAAALTRQFDVGIGLRIEAQAVAVGTLPRSDGKSKRWIDLRTKPASSR
jgi:phenylacetate-CoA ligase